ncbi:MAG: hydroxyacid dehydrogenase [Acidimicrobiia bacterium]|nr:hydroxyacid dehydrogenase [Acidimicrobiia bacterium]
MSRIVVPEYLPEPFLDRFRQHHVVVYDPDLYGDRARLLKEVSDAEAIVVRNRTQIDTEFLGAAPAMKVVGRLGVGLDSIDTEACREAGVIVIPAVGANTVSVAEYVLGAMLVLTRRVYAMTDSMLAGEWPRQGHAFGRELEGKALGLIGYGAVARSVATRAAAFEMTIAAHDPHVREDDPAWGKVQRMDYDQLLAQSDIVSLHVPLDDQTRGMIDSHALAKFKPEAILINTSRGGIVDQVALARSLRDGALGGAAVDVFEIEPLGPVAAATFEGIENLILTPHLAGNTRESVDRVAQMTVDSVLQVLQH